MKIDGSEDDDGNDCIDWMVLKQLSKKRSRFNPVGLLGILLIASGLILCIFDLKNAFPGPPQYIISVLGVLIAVTGLCTVIVAFMAYRRYRLHYRNKSRERQEAKTRAQRRCSMGYPPSLLAFPKTADDTDEFPPVFCDEDRCDVKQDDSIEPDLQKHQTETLKNGYAGEVPLFGELGSGQSYKTRPLVLCDEDRCDVTNNTTVETDLQKNHTETSSYDNDKEFPLFGELGYGQSSSSSRKVQAKTDKTRQHLYKNRAYPKHVSYGSFQDYRM